MVEPHAGGAMTTALRLRAGSIDALSRYVATQLGMFPAGGFDADVECIQALLDPTLERMRPILEAVRAFDATAFDHFHSLQYASFLYLLANESWRRRAGDRLPDRLFALNRALNAIDLFYAVCMPEVFFISHGVGSVLGNATYGSRLVFFQNVTVGRVGEDRPAIGANVVLYAGAVVTGSAVVGDDCVVAAGTVVHNTTIPENTVVASGGGELRLKPRTRDFSGLYLHPTG
jgi:serine O-acetyltransferase